MTPARPRLPASEVERLAKRLRAVFYLGRRPLVPFHKSDAWPNWELVARHVLKHYVARPSRKRPAKTGKGKR